MIIAYYSLTGNVRRFVGKLGRPGALYTIKPGVGAVLTELFVLVTPTTGFGQVPTTVTEFLRNNADMLAGVIASGNVNWGVNFGKAGRIISEQYDVPLIHTFELSGTDADVRIVNEYLNTINEGVSSY